MEAFIYEAIRTPRGRGKPGGDGKAGGALYEVKPVTLVVGLVQELRRRFPTLDPARIDDMVLGCVTAVGDQGMVIARTAALLAGLPDTVAGVTLNRFCASGLEAVNTAAQKVRAGWDDLIVAGGVESMSRVPMGSDGGAIMMDPESGYAIGVVPQGISADLLATIEGFTRSDVDGYAAQSHARAAKAWADGAFDRTVVPVTDRVGQVILDRDEHIRADTTPETLAGLDPSFAVIGEMGGFDAVALQRYHWVERIDHVHTAGNSSGIVDGAALVLIGSESVGYDLGLTPRARVVAAAVTGAEPLIMLTGPAIAARKALAKARLRPDQIDLYEVNEAFAAVPLRFMRDLDLDAERVNVNGGAIAMGHPLGATGAMLVGSLLDELERRELRYGMATLCVGGGMGIATIIERL
ncbi:MAG TPA: acetyl-CoA C-acetyltransferase [Micromonosporaceae bacterium]|jgi:acetyl-CoA C-acetyltransferase|nr:acetyl-CoA C-acetyltransferase [Micromonosporaceae bacterium]